MRVLEMLFSHSEHCVALDVSLVPYRLSSKLWRVVVDVGDSDDGGGCVGETVHWVAFHVSSLDDQRVLGHFLKGKRRETTLGLKTQFSVWQ